MGIRVPPLVPQYAGQHNIETPVRLKTLMHYFGNSYSVNGELSSSRFSIPSPLAEGTDALRGTAERESSPAFLACSLAY